MSLEAGRSEIIGNLVPSSLNVLDLSSKLDFMNYLFWVVAKVLEQNFRFPNQHVHPLYHECPLHPHPFLVCFLSGWHSLLALTSVLVHRGKLSVSSGEQGYS